MKQSRKHLGYLYNGDQIQFSDLRQYKVALCARNTYTEEIAYQSVFHKRAIATKIATELLGNHQPVSVQDCDILFTSDENLKQLAYNDPSYIVVLANEYVDTPELAANRHIIIEKIIETNNNELTLYVLAFIILHIGWDTSIDFDSVLLKWFRLKYINLLIRKDITTEKKLVNLLREIQLGSRYKIRRETSKLLNELYTFI